MLEKELARVPPSSGPYMNYKPCQVVLADGTVRDHVYVQDATGYFRTWGVWPEDDRAKRSVDVSRVVEIRNSPTRLPVRFANQLYEAGESGMGGCSFTILFSDNLKQAYATGNALDFVPYPDGRTPADILQVFPHERGEPWDTLQGSEYSWCLYSL